MWKNNLKMKDNKVKELGFLEMFKIYWWVTLVTSLVIYLITSYYYWDLSRLLEAIADIPNEDPEYRMCALSMFVFKTLLLDFGLMAALEDRNKQKEFE